MKIWVIEQGTYSSYHVVGVFSSKANAQLIADKIDKTYDTPEIVEWELDPAVAELNSGMKQFAVFMRKDGTTESIDEIEFSAYKSTNSHSVWERTKIHVYKDNPDFPDVLQSTIWARNLDHAIKIANDVRLQWVAEGKF